MTEQLRCILKDNWHYLKIGGEQYIVKSMSEDAADSKPFYVVLISNFIDVWSEKVYADEIIQRNSTLNPNIEVPIGRLLSHIQQIFKSSKLSIKNKSEDEITIVSRSCLSSLPYKWEFQLHKCDRQVVADQLTFPLIAAIAELNRHNEHLVKIILVKDVQIESGETENILSKENKGFEIAAFQKEMNESAELATTVATSINTTFGKKLEPIFKSVNEKLFRSSENKDEIREESVEIPKAIESSSVSANAVAQDSAFLERERRIQLERKLEEDKLRKSSKSNKKLKL